MNQTRKCRDCKKVKELNSINFPDRKLKKAPPFRWECRSCYNEVKRTKPSYWAHKMLSGARRRTLDRGWPPCTLTAQDIWNVWPIDFKCPVLGGELIHGHEDRYNSPTLERINNSKGYIIGNILVVSHRANCIKNDGTWQEILKVANFYKQLEENKKWLKIG